MCLQMQKLRHSKAAADPRALRDLPTTGDVSSLLLALRLLQHYRMLLKTQTPERRGVLSGGVLRGHVPRRWDPRVSCAQLPARTLGNNSFGTQRGCWRAAEVSPHCISTAWLWLCLLGGAGVPLQNAPPRARKGLGAGLAQWL